MSAGALDPLEAQKAVVRRYFSEVLDGGNAALALELFAQDCLVHRPELSGPLRGAAAVRAFLEPMGERYRSFRTTVHQLIAEGDSVAARLRHDVVLRDDFRSRLGPVPSAGKALSWEAVAVFHFAGGKIAEEWVSRDELGMLRALGAHPRIDS